MSRAIGQLNLASSESRAFTALDAASTDFAGVNIISEVRNCHVGNVYFDSTVTGAGAYFRPEIWTSWGGSDWYFATAYPAQGNAHKQYAVKEFGPYIRVKYGMVGQGTIRAMFTYREDA